MTSAAQLGKLKEFLMEERTLWRATQGLAFDLDLEAPPIYYNKAGMTRNDEKMK